MSKHLLALIVLFTVAALAGCTRGGESPPGEVTRVVTTVVAVTAPPAAAPARPKELVICMAQEPASLYVYGEATLTARAVRHALYTNYITNLSYDYQADGLEKIPSLASGDAVVETVQAGAGDIVRRADDTVGPLAVGDAVVDATGATVTFGGAPLTLGQMIVDFTMKPTIWSDGTPVSAADSVYSFHVAAQPETNAPKYTIERTAAYEATGDLSVRWTGLPGFTDSTYFLNFWQPLPEHLWGDLSAAELMQADEANRLPVGDGPFRITQWTPGESMRLTRNDHYYRADEGLPYLDRVTIRFIPDANQLLAQLLNGQCDIGTQDGLSADVVPLLLEAEASGLLTPHFATGTIYEQIAFNINPYGDTAATRPNWFQDARVRQAMLLCTDRQRMIDDVLYGRSEVIDSYVPAAHPLYAAEELTQWPYDPAAGNALLDEAGYGRRGADGIRLDLAGARFAPALSTTAGNALRLQVSQIFRENMAACGIDVALTYLPPSVFLAAGPEGVLFGRRYDLGLFAWLTGVRPACDLYMGWRVPGPAGEVFKATGVPYTGWGGDNFNQTGWANPAYDAACQTALGSLPGTPAYVAAHTEAQRIFAQELPVLPLFLGLKVSATQPDVLNFSLDPTQNSELYNLYEIDVDPRLAP